MEVSSVAQFEAARAYGTPLYVIAQEQGVDIEDVRQAMRDVREAAIEEALAGRLADYYRQQGS